MTQQPDPIFDPVQFNIGLLCASAKPADPALFMEQLQAFTKAVLREAFENQDHVRELLDIRRRRGAADPHDEQFERLMRELNPERARAPLDANMASIFGKCNHCLGLFVEGIEHWCASMSPVLRQFPRTAETSSTSAAAAVPSAAKGNSEADRSTASENPPAALSTPKPCESCGAEGNTHATSCGSEPSTIAEPASSQQPQPSTSSTASADDSGTPPAGPDAGAGALQTDVATERRGGRRGAFDAATRVRIHDRYAEVVREKPELSINAAVRIVANELGVSVSSVYRFASGTRGETAQESGGEAQTSDSEPESTQTEISSPSSEPPAPPPDMPKADEPKREPAPAKRLTEQQCRQVVELYRAARPKGAPLPSGWLAARAAEWGVPYESVYNAIEATKRELDELAKRPPQASAPPPRVHLNSERCWCRLNDPNLKNPHCKVLDKKPRDRLVEPQRRVTRMVGERY